MKILIAFAFYMIYWLICFLCTGTDRKNLSGLRSYPDPVQQAVRKHPVLGSVAPKERPAVLVWIGNLLMFTAVFSLLGLALKNPLRLSDYQSAFWFIFALGEGLGLFDLLVIDLLWWRNTKRIRFSFLPEKEAYRDPKKHIDSFCRGILLFALAAVFAAGAVTLAA